MKPLYVVTDLETTGLDPNTCYPYQLGMIFVDHTGKVLHRYFEWLKIPEGVTAEPGADTITWGNYENQYRYSPIVSPVEMTAKRLRNLFQKSAPDAKIAFLVGSNPEFDHSFLKKHLWSTLPEGDIPLYHHQMVNVSNLAMVHYHSNIPMSLQRVMDRMEFLKQSHDAWDDATQTWKAFDYFMTHSVKPYGWVGHKEG